MPDTTKPDSEAQARVEEKTPETTRSPLPHPAKLRWWRRWSPNRQRLYGEVISFRGELEARAPKPAGENQAWWKEVSALVGVAGEHARRRSVAVGFEALNAARRVAVADYSPVELQAEAAALNAEAQDDKLREWRRAAIETIIKPLDAEPPPSEPEQQSMLRHALRIRDEGLQNTHRKNGIVASRYLHLVAVVLLAVSLLLWLSGKKPLGDLSMAMDGTEDWPIWLYAFLFGVIGASISAGLSLTKGNTGSRTPEVRIGTIPTVFRPIFGGSAGIGVLAILSADLFTGLTTTHGTVAAVAFLAGFSERLIDSVAGRFESHR
jgi:hypothetical protein